jgi:hypothetical protein
MEAGEKCNFVVASAWHRLLYQQLGQTEKIQQSAQKTTKLHTSNVRYTRNFSIDKMEQLLTICVDGLNQKKNSSHSACYCCKARSLFDETYQKKKKVETRHLLLAKDGLQCSSNAHNFIA